MYVVATVALCRPMYYKAAVDFNFIILLYAEKVKFN